MKFLIPVQEMCAHKQQPLIVTRVALKFWHASSPGKWVKTHSGDSGGLNKGLGRCIFIKFPEDCGAPKFNFGAPQV